MRRFFHPVDVEIIAEVIHAEAVALVGQVGGFLGGYVALP